jgi:hypothetical protein
MPPPALYHRVCWPARVERLQQESGLPPMQAQTSPASFGRNIVVRD